MTKQDWLKKLIESEVRKALSEAEGAEDALFGKYLWADKFMKVDGQYGGGRIRKDDVVEPNTKAENEFYSAYMRHVGGSGHTNFGTVVNKFLKPMLAQGLYREFIVPPPGPLYRGMRLSVKQAAKFLRLSEKEILADRKQAWYVDGGGIIPAKKNQVMSWSTQPETAYEFAEMMAFDEVPVIFVAYPEDGGDFFLNPTGLLSKFDFGNNTGTILDEMEVVSVGPTPFREAAYYNPSDPEKVGHPTWDEINQLGKDAANKLLAAIESDGQGLSNKAAVKAFLADFAEKLIADTLKQYPFFKHMTDEQMAEVRESLRKTLVFNELDKRLLKLGKGDISVESFRGMVWMWERKFGVIMGNMEHFAKRSFNEGTLQYEDLEGSLFQALAVKKKKFE